MYGFDCLRSVGLSNIQEIGNAQVISIEYVIISIALSLKIQMENQNDNKLVNPIVKSIEMKLTPHIYCQKNVYRYEYARNWIN